MTLSVARALTRRLGLKGAFDKLETGAALASWIFVRGHTTSTMSFVA